MHCSIVIIFDFTFKTKFIPLMTSVASFDVVHIFEVSAAVLDVVSFYCLHAAKWVSSLEALASWLQPLSCLLSPCQVFFFLIMWILCHALSFGSFLLLPFFFFSTFWHCHFVFKWMPSYAILWKRAVSILFFL